MRKMRTLLLSLTGLLLALIVTACGSGNGAGTGEARIIEFSATGLTKGEGEWQLSWATDADSVQLNGQPVTVTGELQVQPEDVTDYVLSASKGPHEAEETITLAPVSTIIISGARPLTVGRGQQLQLDWTVRAEGSDIAPSQGVRVTSQDGNIATVNDSGLITGHAAGHTTLVITSLQDDRVTAQVEVEVLGAGLHGLDAPDAPSQLEAGQQLRLSWLAVDLARLDLVELPSGTRHSIQPPDQSGLSWQVPGSAGSFNLELQWTDVRGNSATARLWPSERPVLGWVCDRDQRPDQLVTFPDPVLEAAVRNVYGLSSSGPIRCADVQRVLPSSVNDDGQEERNAIILNRCSDDDLDIVQSLEGLQHLTHLVRLELECNNISDIRRLASMSSLEEINFDNNAINDVTPLRGLNRVRVLGLYNNDLTDISGLEGLSSLEILYLSENRVKDVSPLAGLNRLQHAWLYLNCNDIDYSDHPDPAERYIIRWADCLTDLSPLAGLTELVSLVFHQNEVEDISFIHAGMSELELIIARGNRISDASSLSGLASLRTVLIDENYLADLTDFTSNPAFPAPGGVYQWQRGTVIMPPTGAFEGHLLMGYNCFDPASAAVQAQIRELEDRGAVVIGADAPYKPECTPEVQRLVPEQILRSLDSLRHR